MSPVLIPIVVIVGVLIGSVGIGGVLLAPSLKYIGGMDLHTAIPVCMFGYIATGTVGAWIYARHGTINRAMAIWLCGGALPGAFVGALLLPLFSATILEAGIAALTISSGLNSLRKAPQSGSGDLAPRLSPGLLAVVGFIAGAGSSLSGTGGPLLLIPILMWVKVPVVTAIGLSQVIQIPISTMASAGNLVFGQLDWRLGLWVGAVLIAGSALGAKSAHILPVSFMKRLIALLLIAVGIWLLVRLILF